MPRSSALDWLHPLRLGQVQQRLLDVVAARAAHLEPAHGLGWRSEIMTHFNEMKAWLAAYDHWRRRLDGQNVPAPPALPPVLEVALLDLARALDDDSRDGPEGEP